MRCDTKVRCERNPSGCAISGIFNKKGKRIDGTKVIKSITLMHDRSNGLGGGFAAYGIYPKYKDYYAFHIMYDDEESKASAGRAPGRALHHRKGRKNTHPQRPTAIKSHPTLWRYFVKVDDRKLDGTRRGRLRRQPGHGDQLELRRRLHLVERQEHGRVQGRRISRGYRRTSSSSKTTRLTSGRPTAGSRRTRRDGGAGLTRYRCWTGRSCTTARSRPMALINDTSRCSATSWSC